MQKFQFTRLFVLVVLGLFLTLGIASAAPAALTDLSNNLSQPSNGALFIHDSLWQGQTFTTGAANRYITDVQLVLCRQAPAPTGLVTIDIYSVDGAHLPVAKAATVAGNVPLSSLALLGSGACTQADFPLSPPIALTASTEYALVLHVDNTDGLTVIATTSNSGTGMASSRRVVSETNGASWYELAGTYALMRIVASDAPTAVTLATFNATSPAPRTVRVQWTTQTESSNAGFNVWRKTKDGEWKKLNAALIASKNLDGVTPAKYAFKDTTAHSGKVYRYKLEMVGLNGASEMSRVVRVRVK